MKIKLVMAIVLLVVMGWTPRTPTLGATPTNPTGGGVSEDLQVVQVVELRPGVWLHTSWNTLPSGVRYPSNGMILHEAGEVTLIDTAWGVEATALLLDWIRNTLNCPVSRVVITHAHDDRAGGVPVLLERGVPVFAESRTVALMNQHGETRIKQLGVLAPGDTADLGNLQILFPGAGHSPDNVVVWIPEQRILFGGCAVRSIGATTMGNTDDADLANWPKALALIQERYGAAEVVVPGHGAVGGAELLDHSRTLFIGSQPRKVTPIPVILDTDIGSDIDDTWALIHLLRSPELDPKLILTCTCDTKYRALLTARLLQVAGRTDIPIGMGPQGSPCNEFQKPWLADDIMDQYPGTVHEDGIEQLIDIIHASPVPVTIIAIGPTGNIAEALRRDPSIASKARYVGMQGSIDVGYGGGAPLAEANVRENPAAFRAVLGADWLDVRITPLDTSGDIVLAGDRYQRVRRSGDPLLQALMENYRIWSGLVTWIKVDFFETRSSTLFDLVAIYMAYTDEHLSYETIPIRVTDEGMTVRHPGGRPVRVALRWNDQQAFLNHLEDRLAGPESATAEPGTRN